MTKILIKRRHFLYQNQHPESKSRDSGGLAIPTITSPAVTIAAVVWSPSVSISSVVGSPVASIASITIPAAVTARRDPVPADAKKTTQSAETSQAAPSQLTLWSLKGDLMDLWVGSAVS